MKKGGGIFAEIRENVKQIPKGRVTTYGDIANMVGLRDARKVGWALHGNTDPSIPCHRVVKKDGFLAKSYGSQKDPLLEDPQKVGEFNFSSPGEQRVLLAKEGIEFLSEDQLDLEKHRWEI